MDLGLVIAGVICVAMAFGHETIGDRWVLPNISEEHLPPTPFGPPSMGVAMVKVTWHIVTIFVATMGITLFILASAPDSDSRSILLRTLAVMWLVATVMAAWIALRRRRSLRGMLRLPVPLLWVIVALLCWNAAT